MTIITTKKSFSNHIMSPNNNEDIIVTTKYISIKRKNQTLELNKRH